MVTRNMQKVNRNRKQLSIQNIILYSFYDKINNYIILVKRDIAFSSRSLTVVTKMHVVTLTKPVTCVLGNVYLLHRATAFIINRKGCISNKQAINMRKS